MPETIVHANSTSLNIDAIELETDTLFDNKVSVGAAGALLGYLSGQDDGQPAIAQIRIIRLKQYMPVGEDVLSTLGIVDRDQHPNMHALGRAKEGLSLFKERLDAVEFLLQPKNTAKHEEMRGVLARMKSIRTVCARIHTELLVADLEALAQFAYATVKLHNIVLSLENVPDILGKFLDVDRTCFNEIGSRIIRMVDFNNSKEEQRFDMLETILSQWSQQMSQAIGLPVAAVYYPQLGFLTSIEVSLLKFQTDEHQYFKNEFTEELDRTPWRCAEVGLELQRYICEHVQQIGEAYEMAAEIDCLQALATFASTQCIHIVGGRHPVLESTVADSSFIANSIHLCGPGCLHEEELEVCSDDNPQTLVLVGPNASGKSVLLKQTALAVYMAHIGSFVPADFAIVSLTDRIFVMGKAMESLYRHTSALSADLELFGRGTNPADGLGLFCGVMVSLSSRSRDRPMLIAVTHFHAVMYIVGDPV
ncbi:hypothetical protein DL89DRAFT_291256 [Linderina pennispora]|uniref:DNA mismatch repair proteins mutS family domain-containing protein n=1 Tax=Linderina pennispora TaxID=61395 RepID=A0A1Y1WEV5_9FUNG|nr:uncharacterized protein DL89DRAFT_291256 [Linderina pennispora]ORX72002.1 hypothetical protein DL89DRAFT_291256 [Linderina pennispora]